MQSPTRSWLLATAALLLTPICAQTFTSCNPLDATCPADPALGGTTNIDFANGASSQFTVVGAPTYDGNGAHFSVAQQGDAPTITSKWYIMFGRVDVVMQAAPGTGIVSSMVLQSNDLDEIDLEWLGGDDGQVQSNYFGKGLTTTYNRGAFHAAPANHDSLHTYSVEWTSESVTWFVNGSPVRTLTAAAADPGQYPQTPMQLKLGVWAGGDPSNAPGTIQWAGGPTNYGGGPYTMTVKSVAATDYSTGQSYTYGDTSGTWQSIKSNGGAVYSGSSAPAGSGSTGSGSSGSAAAPSLNNVAPSKPSSTTLPGIPSGWVASATAHVVDPSSAAVSEPAPVFCGVIGLFFCLYIMANSTRV